MKFIAYIKNIFLKYLRLCFKVDLVQIGSKRPIQIVEATPFDLQTLEIASKISMQSYERMWALISATKYVVKNNIPGHFVECGVYKGGSAVIIARTLISMNVTNRKIYLYDTFEGMTNPIAFDKKQGTETQASQILAETPKGNGENVWAISSMDSVVKVLQQLNYSFNNFQLIKGDVLETLNQTTPESIALLRLDTDWYESTKKEMEVLYPLVKPGGVVIVDDYGHWSGSRKAIDEFLGNKELQPLMNYIDYAGRLWIK